MSLILVDRTLDLAGTVVSFVDSMFGRIIECHEKLEGHTLGINKYVQNIFKGSAGEYYSGV